MSKATVASPAPAVSSNGAAKSKKANPFRAIDAALIPKTGGRQGAAKRALRDLAAGKQTVKRKDKESGERVAVDRPLRPGKTVALVIAALRGGIAVDEIQKAAPDLAERFAWSQVRDAIVAAATEAKVEDADGFSKLFGLADEKSAPKKPTAAERRVQR